MQEKFIKFMSSLYRVMQVITGALIAAYFAFQAVRGFTCGHVEMGIAMAMCAALGVFIFNLARKEYKQFKRYNNERSEYTAPDCKSSVRG